MWRGIAVLVALISICSSAVADIPGPGRPPPPEPELGEAPVAPAKTTLPVTVKQADLKAEGKGVQAKVSIPRKLLARLAPGAVPAAVRSERQSSLPWWSTIIAGLALSAGAVGVVFAARGNKAARVAAIASVVIAALAGGYAFADLRVPDEEELRPRGGETIILEVVDDGDAVVLTLPPPKA